jgi:hypothetical protein
LAGAWATFVWISSGLYLYLTTKGASLSSWSSVLFFFVGTFVAAIVFGVAFHLIQRGVAKALVEMVHKLALKHVMWAFSLVQLVIETVLIYVAARWVFYAVE